MFLGSLVLFLLLLESSEWLVVIKSHVIQPLSVNFPKSDILICDFDLKHLTEKQFVLSGNLLIKHKSALHRPGLLAVGLMGNCNFIYGRPV